MKPIVPFPVQIFLAIACLGIGASAETSAEPVSDKTIALAVEARILRSDEVRSKKVRAEVSKGVVTLAGRVDNLHASRQAARIAGEVRGVKAVLNQIIVETNSVPDGKLSTLVKDKLAAQGTLPASSIRVKASQGEVTLSGEVTTLAEKQLAAATTASVQGVTAIQNELQLAATEGLSDEELQTDISALLDHAALLDESTIQTTVESGVATLKGEVATLAQKLKAIHLASIAGIREVRHGGLRVEWKQSDGMQRRRRFEALTEKSLRESIQLAMKHHPLLVAATDGIEVEVRRADVTLSGTVSRIPLKQAAAEVARSTMGVQSVTNRIRVDWPEEAPSDEAITEAVSEAIERDAYLGFAEIIPRTRNAHVHLYGLVDTEFEKRRAGRIAGTQPGVVHVANYLSVVGEWDPKPDSEIEKAIRDRIKLMETDPLVQVTVDVANGVPVFRGHVATWFQWQGLLDIARQAGARRPHIEVDIHYQPTDEGTPLYVPE